MAKFEMDTEFIRKLADILTETGLSEIEVDHGGRLRSASPSRHLTAAAPVHYAAPARPPPRRTGRRRRFGVDPAAAPPPAPRAT